MSMRHDPTVGFDGILGGIFFHYVSDCQCCAVPYAGLIDYCARDYREAQTVLEKDCKGETTIGPSDRPLALEMLWHLPTKGPRPKPSITLEFGDKASSVAPPTNSCKWKAASVLRCGHLILVADLTPLEHEKFQTGGNVERGWISVKECVGGIVNSLYFDVEPDQWHRPLAFDEIDRFVRHIASHAGNRS